MSKLTSTPYVAKRMALSWYWTVTILVFDPGIVVARSVYILDSSMRTRMILRGWYCYESCQFILETTYWAKDTITSC